MCKDAQKHWAVLQNYWQTNCLAAWLRTIVRISKPPKLLCDAARPPDMALGIHLAAREDDPGRADFEACTVEDLDVGNNVASTLPHRGRLSCAGRRLLQRPVAIASSAAAHLMPPSLP